MQADIQRRSFAWEALQTFEVYYDAKVKIFHRKEKQGQSSSFIQNTKKGFYVKDNGVITFTTLMKAGTFARMPTAISIIMDAMSQKNMGSVIGLFWKHSEFYTQNSIRKVIASISILQQQFSQSKMKQTVILTLVVAFLLCQFAFSQAVEVNNRRGNGRGNNKGSNRNAIPPSIRKCQDVKCEPGFFCLNGRCKKVDYGCINLKCEKGFRCNKGQCVKQAHEPREQVCKPLGYQRKKLQCGPEQQQRCQTNNGILGVCGFIGGRKFQDFESECAICQARPLARFFFSGSCTSAPRVCTADQQCLNGVCTKIFNESVFENYRTCNKNQDCKVRERCAGHKCVDKRDMFNYLQSKAEADQMGVTA